LRIQRSPVATLDKLDRHILDLLQRDGRMSMTDLAEAVGLTVTPCIERVRRLEREGIIMGYHARVAPTALDAGLLVFVEVSISSKSERSFEDFRREVLCIPHVQECHLVSGDFDYMIKARIKEIGQYRSLLGDILLRLPGVTQTKSCIVMEELKETLYIPAGAPCSVAARAQGGVGRAVSASRCLLARRAQEHHVVPVH
jgi:Lrp/AsnC family leucine-responsive transcriptional regulator